MARIYSYQVVSDDCTTYHASGDGITELCTLDGTTYFAGPDVLPPQPEQISIAPVELTDALRERIKAASPHTQLIHQRMEEMIRAQYSLADEQYFARIGVGVALGIYQFQAGEQEQLLAFGTFVENVRVWGRQQRADLGL
jgi:hypothetical protein